MIHANLNQSTGFNNTYNAIIVKICKALSKYGVVVLGARFDGDKCQVNFTVPTFMTG